MSGTSDTINKIIDQQGSLISSLLVDKAPVAPNYYGCKTPVNAIKYDFISNQQTANLVVRISLTGFPELESFVSTGRLGCIFSADGTTANSCAKIDRSAIKDNYIELTYVAGSPVSSFSFFLLIEYQNIRTSVSDILTASYIGSGGITWYGIFDKFLNLFNNLLVTAVMASNEWTKPEGANCPFYTASAGKLPAIPLSALPFRAYESYYNALVS